MSESNSKSIIKELLNYPQYTYGLKLLKDFEENDTILQNARNAIKWTDQNEQNVNDVITLTLTVTINWVLQSSDLHNL